MTDWYPLAVAFGVGVIATLAVIDLDRYFRLGERYVDAPVWVVRYLLVSATSLAYYRPQMRLRHLPRIVGNSAVVIDDETRPMFLELVDGIIADATERGDTGSATAWTEAREAVTG